MFKNPMIWIVSLVTVLAACGDGTSNGTVDNDDASTTNPETAVREDAPISQPDVPVTAEDAGNNNPDVATDTGPAIEDRPPIPADEGGTMTATPFSSEICRQLNDRCWRIQGTDEACDQIPCRMITGGRARVIVPPSLLVQMGYPNATCSDRTCRLESIMNIPSNCYWVDLSETMSHFRCTCPGQPDINVESL